MRELVLFVVCALLVGVEIERHVPVARCASTVVLAPIYTCGQENEFSDQMDVPLAKTYAIRATLVGADDWHLARIPFDVIREHYPLREGQCLEFRDSTVGELDVILCGAVGQDAGQHNDLTDAERGAI